MRRKIISLEEVQFRIGVRGIRKWIHFLAGDMGYVGLAGNSWLMTVMGSVKLGLQRVGNMDGLLF